MHARRRCLRLRARQRSEHGAAWPSGVPAAPLVRGAESATLSASAGAHLDQGATGPPPGGGRAYASDRPRRGRGGYRCPVFRRGLSMGRVRACPCIGCADAQNASRMPRRCGGASLAGFFLVGRAG